MNIKLQYNINVTNLEDGKQLPAIIDVFWALVVKQEPVDDQKSTHLILSNLLHVKWEASYNSDESCAIKKVVNERHDCLTKVCS